MRRTAFYILFALLFLSSKVLANMAEPVNRGTLGSSPFISQYAVVSKEVLSIDIASDFETAKIKAIYHISAQADGVKIPMLFYASEYQDDFQVRVDGQVVDVKEVPDEYTTFSTGRFKDFDYYFKNERNSYRDNVLIEDGPGSGFYANVDDFKYFESDFAKGEHTIVVTYTASKWTDRWDWVNKYSFRYALSPAKYWKSFGSLEVLVNAPGIKGGLTTNLGGKIHNGRGRWTFDSLPVEMIKISRAPEIGSVSKAMLAIGPFWASVCFALLMALIHYKLSWSNRFRHPTTRFNWVSIWGSFVLPALVLLFWINFISWTKSSLGEHAGMGVGPYAVAFVPLFFYPLMLLIYGSLMWVVDRRWKSNRNGGYEHLG